MNYRHRPAWGLTVENKRGQKFRCIGWGKAWYKCDRQEKDNYCLIRSYQDVFTFIEYNTENEPIQFDVNREDFHFAVEQKKLVYC